MSRCGFCPGDASEPNHDQHCDGRQGRLEFAHDPDDTFPIFASGLTPDTYATSLEAGASVVETKETQRERVYAAFDEARAEGRTDDKVQELLNLSGNSERPRRLELWKQGRIDVLRDATGHAIRRPTRAGNRDAVVWVAVRWLEECQPV